MRALCLPEINSIWCGQHGFSTSIRKVEEKKEPEKEKSTLLIFFQSPHTKREKTFLCETLEKEKKKR
jgi:hypothetical protein